MQFCCCPFALKAKYHPWIYIVLFTVINPFGSLALISGFIVGYLYHFGALSWLQITDGCAKSLEDSFLFSCCRDHSTFIRVDEASKNLIAGSGGLGLNMPNYLRQQNDRQDNRQANRQNNDTEAARDTPSAYPTPEPFKGGGVRLGGN